MGAEPSETIELAIPAEPEYLSLARLLVASTASVLPLFPLDRLDDLRLAVSEACTNAIEAQIQAQQADASAADHIHIRCCVAEESVTVEVQDHGRGFDPAALSEHPPVTDPTRLDYERGLGIPLMRILTDEVEFVPSASGTTVRMILNVMPRVATAVEIGSGDLP